MEKTMLYLFVYLYDIYNSVLFIVAFFTLFFFISASLHIKELSDLENKIKNEQESPKTFTLKTNKDSVNYEELYKSKSSKVTKQVIKFTLACLLFLFLPSKQGFVMLSGVYVGNVVAEQVDKSEIINKAVKILNKELDICLDKLNQGKTE